MFEKLCDFYSNFNDPNLKTCQIGKKKKNQGGRSDSKDLALQVVKDKFFHLGGKKNKIQI